jgi:CheY-like chemotaxis protein
MQTEGNGEGKAMHRPKIMVVDDDSDLRQALSLRLRANQFETINVCDGYSAIAMAHKERPHLIILDLGLPAGDGFAVLRLLQEYPALARIPVIVLTARDPEGNEKRTLEEGLTAFFQKPADNEELLGVIRACLETGWGMGRDLAIVAGLWGRFGGSVKWRVEIFHRVVTISPQSSRDVPARNGERWIPHRWHHSHQTRIEPSRHCSAHGASRETASRTLTTLRNNGVVE